MTVLFTNANIASMRINCKVENKRIAGGGVRGGQKAPQAHITNPCDPGGPGL